MKTHLDDFTRAYLECVLWFSTDNACTCDGHENGEQGRHAPSCGFETGGEPLDHNYGIEDFAPEALAKAFEDCQTFRKVAQTLLDDSEFSEESAGHDFWLTRNGHGAGFWDRDLGTLGDSLTDIAHSFGSCDVYIGDDGQLYLS